MPTDEVLRRIARDHAREHLHEDVADVRCVGMTETDAGTRVGMEVLTGGAKTGGALIGGLLGTAGGLLVALLLLPVFPEPFVLLLVVVVVAWLGVRLGRENAGAATYSTVTIDDAGDVVLSNTDVPEGDFNEMLDREIATAEAEARAERRGEFQEQLREEILRGMAGAVFGTGDDGSGGYSPPERCPLCKQSGSLFSEPFVELSTGTYQCTNTDCAHIVDLTGD